MTLAMSWDEWAAHDAIGLAEKVRKGDLTPKELALQAAAGIEKTNPASSAVIEVFEDVVADPLKDGLNPNGPFAGRALPDERLRPHAQRAFAGARVSLHAGQSTRRGHIFNHPHA